MSPWHTHTHACVRVSTYDDATKSQTIITKRLQKKKPRYVIRIRRAFLFSRAVHFYYRIFRAVSNRNVKYTYIISGHAIRITKYIYCRLSPAGPVCFGPLPRPDAAVVVVLLSLALTLHSNLFIGGIVRKQYYDNTVKMDEIRRARGTAATATSD